jgi:uncharacterized protein YndB with AHSA1/START domain
MSGRKISVSRFIPAPPEKIFDLLADPKMHPVLDGSGTVRKPRGDNPERLSMGSEFGMEMKLGTKYPIKNRVVEFEEGRRIAWCHFARNIWRYELEPKDGGTLVTETFDPSGGRAPGFVLNMLGFFRRNKAGMEKTLENIERYLAGERRA